MGSDNDELLRLIGKLPIAPEALRPAVRALRDQVDKCQNTDTCDGSIDASVWNAARTVVTNLEHVLLGIEWAKKRYSKGGG